MGNSTRYIEKLDALTREGNFRFFRPKPGMELVNLSSNDYLELGSNEELRTEFYAKHHPLNLGNCSSRLLTGNSTEYEILENQLAGYYQNECLLFNSGYHANIGILPALAGKNDLIIADKLVHASLMDGILLSKAIFQRYNHNDLEQLEKLLQKAGNQFEHIFIVTESIFSMDGDVCDLPKLIELKKEYNAFLYVDEAHAIGVRGKNGLGLCEEMNGINHVDFLVGTFGKAVASTGAFVICNKMFKEYLINHARSLIYTTALPAINLVWTHFLMEKIPGMHDKRMQLKTMAMQFAKAAGREYQSHIIPLITGSNEKAIELSNKLIENGYYALPIKHPTVPKGSERIRFSFTTSVKNEEIKGLINILKNDWAKVVA